MKVQVINKQGQAWEFSSIKKAKLHLKKRPEYLNFYQEKIINGEKIRIYDDKNN